MPGKTVGTRSYRLVPGKGMLPFKKGDLDEYGIYEESGGSEREDKSRRKFHRRAGIRQTPGYGNYERESDKYIAAPGDKSGKPRAPNDPEQFRGEKRQEPRCGKNIFTWHCNE